ncbi:YitT family protein [Amygdalobacter indicium]|uniref:YitT family protein n=1 Tax=Amygdalobacter indicium TaxID=3029272 RepID=A0ABY8C3B8_9FIRM|nr:YitT family protein [Amygdalobacter indicium]WEG35170.1 YitT family protein [Amygdalobacter indicium]
MDSFNHNCRLCDKDASQVVEKIKHDLSETKPQYNSLKTSFLKPAKGQKLSFNSFLSYVRGQGVHISGTDQCSRVKTLIKDYALINLGTLIMTIGVTFFKFPNNFAMGGVTGFSVVFARLVPQISAGTTTIVLNLVCLALGYIFLGRSFGFRTTYSTLLMNALIVVYQKYFHLTKPLTDQPLLELSFAVLLPSIGGALLFYAGGSSGGTDVIAMLMKKYSNVNIGNALVYSDFLITFSSFLVFDIRTVLLSILGMLARGSMVDAVMNTLTMSKYFIIVTTKPDIIGDYITLVKHRGATKLQGEGYFTGQKQTVFICAVGQYQAGLMAREIRKLDEHAFILLTSTNEILGNGFKDTFR